MRATSGSVYALTGAELNSPAHARSQIRSGADGSARCSAPTRDVDSPMEASASLVRASDFKSGEGCGDTLLAGSIPVRFRHCERVTAAHSRGMNP